MRLHRPIAICALLVLIAAAAMVLPRNPSSKSKPGTDSGPASAATHVAASDAAKTVTASTPPQPAPAEAGMMAYIDPETGDLTTGPAPTSELELDLDTQNALRHDDLGLEVKTRADGSKVMNLQGRYQHVSVIHIDANGVKTVCTDNEKAAEHNLNHAPATPSAPEVK